jgi:transcriptional regulator with XRE-family HTH domain
MRTPTEIILALLDRGWTQDAIAKAVGTTQPTICRIAQGRHSNPSFRLVDALRGLEARLDDLGG